MPTPSAAVPAAVAALALTLAAGCGTTRTTNTARTATEQLLLTQAWDDALGQVDFRELVGVPIFLDTAALEVVDKGWVVSSLRQSMLEQGALLREKKEDAKWVVEARVGVYGTDDSNFMVGVPQTTVPAVAGLPGGTIPEMSLLKRTKQKGVTKLALFAYDRASGALVWSSGTRQALSNSKDVYVGGLGPFQSGSIRRGTEFLDVPIPGTAGKAPPLESAAMPLPRPADAPKP